jgi:hypothetical protein
MQRAQRRPAPTKLAYAAKKDAPRDRRLRVSSFFGLCAFLLTLPILAALVTPLVQFVSPARDRSFRQLLRSASLLTLLVTAGLLAGAHWYSLPWLYPASALAGLLLARLVVLLVALLWGDSAARHPLVRW